mgnify:CR=1 FL=1
MQTVLQLIMSVRLQVRYNKEIIQNNILSLWRNFHHRRRQYWLLCQPHSLSSHYDLLSEESHKKLQSIFPLCQTSFITSAKTQDI